MNAVYVSLESLVTRWRLHTSLTEFEVRRLFLNQANLDLSFDEKTQLYKDYLAVAFSRV